MRDDRLIGFPMASIVSLVLAQALSVVGIE
jgi:hypothetical protein